MLIRKRHINFTRAVENSDIILCRYYYLFIAIEFSFLLFYLNCFTAPTLISFQNCSDKLIRKNFEKFFERNARWQHT